MIFRSWWDLKFSKMTEYPVIDLSAEKIHIDFNKSTVKSRHGAVKWARPLSSHVDISCGNVYRISWRQAPFLYLDYDDHETIVMSETNCVLWAASQEIDEHTRAHLTSYCNVLPSTQSCHSSSLLLYDDRMIRAEQTHKIMKYQHWEPALNTTGIIPWIVL